MFRFIKQIIVSASMFFDSLSNVNSLERISMKNQECKVRPEIVNINGNNPIFYPFSIKTNKCSGNCNNINDTYARICVPDTVKNLNVKVFNLMSRTNETRHIKWHETCKYICRLNEIICNNKQKWTKDKCRYECKELIDKRVRDKGFIWNSCNCECECNRPCNIGQYLDYSDCKCKKKLIDPLIEECPNDNDETKLVTIAIAENENSYFNSCKVYIVLMTIVFTIFTGVIIYFISYNWSLIKNNISCTKFNTHKETLIW